MLKHDPLLLFARCGSLEAAGAPAPVVQKWKRGDGVWLVPARGEGAPGQRRPRAGTDPERHAVGPSAKGWLCSALTGLRFSPCGLRGRPRSPASAVGYPG